MSLERNQVRNHYTKSNITIMHCILILTVSKNSFHCMKKSIVPNLGFYVKESSVLFLQPHSCVPCSASKWQLPKLPTNVYYRPLNAQGFYPWVFLLVVLNLEKNSSPAPPCSPPGGMSLGTLKISGNHIGSQIWRTAESECGKGLSRQFQGSRHRGTGIKGTFWQTVRKACVPSHSINEKGRLEGIRCSPNFQVNYYLKQQSLGEETILPMASDHRGLWEWSRRMGDYDDAKAVERRGRRIHLGSWKGGYVAPETAQGNKSQIKWRKISYQKATTQRA